MQLRVRHTTGYRYAEGAIASFNEARMTPMMTASTARMPRSPFGANDYKTAAEGGLGAPTR
jgi:hypothetical protein